MHFASVAMIKLGSEEQMLEDTVVFLRYCYPISQVQQVQHHQLVQLAWFVVREHSQGQEKHNCFRNYYLSHTN